jgi:hypothetical protein
MRLDSVRELKKALPELLRKSLTPKASAARAFAASDVRVARPGSKLPSFALGVSLGKKDYRLAIRLQNRHLESSELLKQITKHARGEVDVRYVGRIYAMATPWYRRMQRPLLVGTSCGTVHNDFIVAGTLGCFVTKKNSNQPLILSNNHVLADENRYPKGGRIVQPGTLDQGKPTTDGVAVLSTFVRLKPTPAVNLVDCAVAKINDGIDIDPTQIKGLGTLAGTRTQALDVGDKVHKLGRTTGLRHGRVTAIEMDGVGVEYDIGVCSFDNQLEIEGLGAQAFSDAGDSGSLIVDQDLKACGLLFAGSDHGGKNGAGLTYGNPIRAVFNALNIKLLI